ncbi:MAG: hypothetical protein ACQEQ4_11325 [Fibrobacterota bacterium]
MTMEKHMLHPGSSVGDTHKKSPLEKKRDNRKKQVPSSREICSYARQGGLDLVCRTFDLRREQAAKIIAPLVRKGEVDVQTLLPGSDIGGVEEFLRSVSMLSMKKMVQASGFAEEEIRLVKAAVEYSRGDTIEG